MGTQPILIDLKADAGRLQRADAAICANAPGRAHQRVAEEVAARDIRFEIASIVDSAEEMLAAWFSPVMELWGCTGILWAEAIAAMRSASVMPPHFDRSGCQTPMAPSWRSGANSKRVKWFSPAASGVLP